MSSGVSAAISSRRRTPAVNSPTSSGSCSLATAAGGPASTLCTRNPGSTSTTSGRPASPGVEGATATMETAVRRSDGELRSWTVKLADGVVEAVVYGSDPEPDVRTEFAVQEDYASFIRGDTRPVYDAYWKGTITVTG